ncbi:hypothetical protein BpHYR1_000033 [Brachionus plicatilis]|uniref:Uncharacterized protein n=1 Tax=Brachionus plicatilis TaxID=10195 RepID=A0A3M7QJA3_BRAPC|nr:hypothetical protein BpHYR1_000033 [Brachionus plicatilis]
MERRCAWMQCWIGHEKKAREQQTLFFQVSGERFLAQLELFEQVRKELGQGLVANAALNHVGGLVSLGHYSVPAFVDAAESLCFSWQLFGNVATHKHRLQVDP